MPARAPLTFRGGVASGVVSTTWPLGKLTVSHVGLRISSSVGFRSVDVTRGQVEEILIRRSGLRGCQVEVKGAGGVVPRTVFLPVNTVVTPGTLAAWLDTAHIERIVFGSPSRVLDVGVTTRFFTGALRRALEVRDRECFEDYCDVPASRCEADHIEPWAAGGRTTERNGRMACGCHNRGREKPPKPPPNPLPDPPPQD